MQKRLLLIFIMHLVNIIDLYSAPQKVFVANSYRLVDGQTSGVIQKNINRAGVLLVVPLDIHSTDPFEKHGIIVGFDKNLKCWMLGQAGKCDYSDPNTAVTASRELEEETGGYYTLAPGVIDKLPYLSAYEKQMFIHKVDDFDLPNKIKKAVKKAQLNSSYSQSYQEINDIEVISLKNLFDLAEKIDSCNIKKGKYFIQTTTSRTIRLNTLYAELFGHSCDHTRLFNSKKIFNELFK